MSSLTAAAASALLLFAVACGGGEIDSPSPKVCAAGDGKACTGANQCAGLQSCAADGASWDPCVCSGAAGKGGSSGAAAGAAGKSGGAAASGGGKGGGGGAPGGSGGPAGIAGASGAQGGIAGASGVGGASGGQGGIGQGGIAGASGAQGGVAGASGGKAGSAGAAGGKGGASGGTGGAAGAAGTAGAGGATGGVCPPPANPCQVAVCNVGVCGVADVPKGTPLPDPIPGDCQASVCDGSGKPVAKANDADVPMAAGPCLVPSCAQGTPKQTPVSQGTTCAGGVCNGGGQCVECLAPSDCPANGTTCKSPVCTGNVCGTVDASKGQSCSDKGGVVCDAAGTCVSMHCMDGVADADETDVDCGGATCSPCGDGAFCLLGKDCTDKVCSLGKCAAPSCADGVQNGTETGIDCGGAACDAMGKTCAPGNGCLVLADCAPSGNECIVVTCSMKVCSATALGQTHVLSTGQTPGDCKKLVCNAAGGTTNIPDDADAPASSPCASYTCAAGAVVPHFQPAGAECGKAGDPAAHVCGDAGFAGQCVQCNQSSDCNALNDAGTLTCSAFKVCQ